MPPPPRTCSPVGVTRKAGDGKTRTPGRDAGNSAAKATRAGRPRDPSTDARLHDATLQVLRERGPAGVTVEAVSQVSGVAKTTIYRRHANAQELLDAALEELTAAIPPPSSLPPHDRLVASLSGFQHGLEAGIGIHAYATLMTRPHDPFAKACRTRLLQPRLEALTALVADLQVQHLVRDDVPAEMIVLMMAGSYFTRTATQGATPESWAQDAVDAWWVD